ncbi:MAG: hypothetical protein K8F35_00545, partial [Dokdonella sp.]|uniref:hypothetical protein n=1 Tax=Dokdonella sp. TaxID=2291710 RepID=UPI0025B8F62C
AVQGCTALESITQVIDSSETSPGMYRTRRAEEVRDGLFQHPVCRLLKNPFQQPDSAAQG